MKIPFKSQLARLKTIAKRNEKFKSLSPKEKRQEIAFDALNLVLLGKLSASYGQYWDTPLMRLQSDFEDEGKTSADLQKALIENLPTCKVCQRGLLMVSTIRLGNKISPSDCDIDEGSRDLLKGKGFKLEDFSKMEDEFECDYHDQPYNTNTDEKLMNICCNVIANGNYKGSDKTDYLVEWKIQIPKLESELA